MGLNEREVTNNKKLKIAVYGIARDAEKYLERFFTNLDDADHIVIGLDVRSKDQTALILRDHGVDIIDIDINPWRFDTARNTVLESIPKDVDVCISLDMDDYLEPGWREIIEEIWRAELSMIRYPYVLSETTIMNGYRIHNRKTAKWILPVHEAMIFPNTQVQAVYTDKIKISHEKAGPATDYTAMILAELEVNQEENERTWLLYLAMREGYKFAKYDIVLKYGKEFLEKTPPFSIYGAQRSEAMRMLGKCFIFSENKDMGQALLWFFRACAEFPIQRENWGSLADGYAMIGDYDFAIPCYIKTLAIKDSRFSEEMEATYWKDEYLTSRIELCKKGKEERDQKCPQPS